MATTSTTNVLITGAGRGLGKHLVESYLSRPNHTVIAAVRSLSHPNTQSLQLLPSGPGSTLIPIQIESPSPTDPYTAASSLQSLHGITHLDIIIAAAGTVGDQGPLEKIRPETVAEVYAVNAVGPALLFMGMRELLERSARPVWMAVSSAPGSVGDYETFSGTPMFPYNGSKAALNHFTKMLHVEFPKLIAFSVSPGLLDTDMGRTGAKVYGFGPEAFTPVDVSVKSLMKLVRSPAQDVIEDIITKTSVEHALLT